MAAAYARRHWQRCGVSHAGVLSCVHVQRQRACAWWLAPHGHGLHMCKAAVRLAAHDPAPTIPPLLHAALFHPPTHLAPSMWALAGQRTRAAVGN